MNGTNKKDKFPVSAVDRGPTKIKKYELSKMKLFILLIKIMSLC